MVPGIFLDDKRQPEDVSWITYPKNIEWVVVRNSEEFQEIVSEQRDLSKVSFSFDHDIQDYDWYGREVTGLDCLKFLVEVCMEERVRSFPHVYLHTQNIVGKKDMEGYITSYLDFCQRMQTQPSCL